jgi:pyrophosphatase PpaX
MKFRAVLFDFDGTLTPSLPLWARSFQRALAHFGLEITEDEAIRRCFFRDWAEIAAELGLANVRELIVRVKLELDTAFLAATLFGGARELVEHCREQGLQTALVTSAPRSLIASTLPRLALADQFDFTICGDEVANYKPHPESLHAALAALGRVPAEAIMVGDSAVDIRAGKAAGTATALFLPEQNSVFHSFAELRALGADHIFADHAELPPFLGISTLPTRCDS